MLKRIYLKFVSFFFKKNFSYDYYPSKFKYIKKKNTEIGINNISLKKNILNDKQTIKLASISIKKKISNFWENIDFYDDENISHIHRWTWAIYLLTDIKNSSERKEKIYFIENVINNWCYKYQNDEIDKKKIIFHPYTISERLSNYSLLVKLGYLKKNEQIINLLKKQMYFLSKNFEFYYKKKSNHVLNNVRGLLLFSTIVKDKWHINFSLSVLFYIIPKFIDKVGFFKFCSSHYQYIFSKWVFDINLFTNNGKLKKKLNSLCAKLLNTCNFFLVKNQIPLIGNISPDYTPEWIMNFFINKKIKNDDFISQYWKNFKVKLNLNKNNISNKEWIKYENKNICFFTRNPKINGLNFNHSHNDFFHFVLFYKNNPIIVDLGRKDYFLESAKKYNSSKLHNSVIVNNEPIFDSYLPHKILTKLGILDVSDINYKVTKLENSVLISSKLNQHSTIKRNFLFNSNYFCIHSIFSFSSFKTIELPFFFHKSLHIIKIKSDYYKIYNKKFLAFVKIESDKKFISKVISMSKEKIYFFNSYGKKSKINCIKICLKNIKSANIKIKINFK